ncbi:glycosyltransferase family 2 protein [Mucilaginibacter sp.]|uniref:glycosyltransferase family 2 protein n=1 Tax=Mucilaginibacter sp. TaxID=1882438 RepID=UPI003AFFFD52
MKEFPVISIITVVFNAVETIEDTIKSVIDQRYHNIEYIVIDGGSTDGTKEIVKIYQAKIKYFISEGDRGVYDAMNKGVKIATGDFVYFLNSGDILLANLEKIIKFLKSEKSIIYGDSYWIGKHILYYGKTSKWKIIRNNICHQSIFYPKNIFNKYSYDLNYKVFADYYLNVSLMADKSYSFIYIPVLICSFDDTVGLSKKIKDLHFKNDLVKLVKAKYSIITYAYFIGYKAAYTVIRPVFSKLGIVD